MINLLGEEGYSGDASYIGIEEVLAMKGVYIHLYGKKITKPFRKMGHVTVTADKLENAIQIARKVQSIIKIISTNN
jgi:5-(carboxyamino)imidazole ribonucleotide synthase